MRQNITKVNNSKLQLNSYLIPLISLLFTLLYIGTGYRGWLIFSIGSFGVILLAIAWILSLRGNLHIDRKLQITWAITGETIQEQLMLVNNSFFPATWVEISDASPTLSKPVGIITDVNSRDSRSRFFNHVCRRRGLYSLGPTTLRTGDPFGIFTLTLYKPHTDKILVTPPIIPVDQIKIPTGGFTGNQWRQNNILDREISDVGVREYVPGDSLRRIHWKASAHFGDLVVRQLETFSSGDWWIFVDLQDKVQTGKNSNSTLELSIVLAASIAVRGLNENHRIGLTFGGPGLIKLEPRGDNSHRWRILKALALASAGKYSLTDLISIHHPKKSASLIIITPSCDTSWVALAGKYHSGNQVALLVDSAEFGKDFESKKIIPVLDRVSIPYYLIPGKYLTDAYSPIKFRRHNVSNFVEKRRRYFHNRWADW